MCKLFALSCWWGCKCRRDRVPANSIAICDVLIFCGPRLLQNLATFTGFWEASALKHNYLRNATFALSDWFVKTGFQPKVLLFTVFWAKATPKHRYLQAFGGQALNCMLVIGFGLLGLPVESVK